MTWWQAVIFGIIEGVTEFLPVSSTGHLTIAEKLMGMPLEDPSIVAFTAVVQIGAIVAAISFSWAIASDPPTKIETEPVSAWMLKALSMVLIPA